MRRNCLTPAPIRAASAGFATACRAALFVTALCLTAPGCGREAIDSSFESLEFVDDDLVPEFDDDADYSLSVSPSFSVTVEERSGDPLEVDVWISTSAPECWRSLPPDADAPIWRQLLVMQPVALNENALSSKYSGRLTSRPVVGAFELVDQKLRFRPLRPLDPGLAYRVEFNQKLIPDLNPRPVAPSASMVSWYITPGAKPTREPPADEDGATVPPDEDDGAATVARPQQR